MPTVAALTNGGFVVTWYEDATPDGGGYIDIKAQIFDVAGTKVGGEFLVNTYQASWYPTITGLTNGGFVITWNDDSGTLGDSSYSSIKAQVFDGAKVGGEIAVNTQTVSNQYYPSITGLRNGGFVVTWYDTSTLGDGSYSSIKAHVFNASGAKVGGEFLVNTTCALILASLMPTTLATSTHVTTNRRSSTR